MKVLKWIAIAGAVVLAYRGIRYLQENTVSFEIEREDEPEETVESVLDDIETEMDDEPDSLEDRIDQLDRTRRYTSKEISEALGVKYLKRIIPDLSNALREKGWEYEQIELKGGSKPRFWLIGSEYYGNLVGKLDRTREYTSNELYEVMGLVYGAKVGNPISKALRAAGWGYRQKKKEGKYILWWTCTGQINNPGGKRTLLRKKPFGNFDLKKPIPCTIVPLPLSGNRFRYIAKFEGTNIEISGATPEEAEYALYDRIMEYYGDLQGKPELTEQLRGLRAKINEHIQPKGALNGQGH